MSRVSVAVLLLVCVSGCSTIGYYHQSISGHFNLISKRERISDIVNDSTRDAKLIEQLRLTEELRSFASSELKLPENDSYRSYVQLDQPYVTWNVFAAPAVSTALHQWCFLVIGCVPYRGYFQEDEAYRYAEQLSTQGLDVYVAGVPAYSTLGWFDDPLLSSMLDRGETIAAAYIFHELAHQQFYLKGDGAFNEAFATAVEEIGVLQWLGQQKRDQDVQRYNDWLQQKTIFSEFVKNSRDEFSILYQQEHDLEKMQVEKEILIAEMRRKFAKLSDGNKHIARYSKWMSGPLNNAQLGAISLYRELVPAFRRMFELCGSDFEKFYRSVENISKLPESQREAKLNANQACL
ncbi:MAG: aminopeptidase [Gammaproteobacteria bacterium]